MDRIPRYLGDETGASAAEYALILAFVAIVIVTGLGFLGVQINNSLSTMASDISTAEGG
ncbi:MAG: Flp family type IVb pilin [Caulobacteraceae bacterium]